MKKKMMSNKDWKNSNNYHNVKTCGNCKYCFNDPQDSFIFYVFKCKLMPNKRYNSVMVNDCVCDKFKQRKGDMKYYDD